MTRDRIIKRMASTDRKQELISADEQSCIVDSIYPLLANVKHAKKPLNFSQHPLFSPPHFQNNDGTRTELHKDFDKIVGILYESFNTFYTYTEVRNAVVYYSKHIRNDFPSPPVKRTATELVTLLGTDSEALTKESIFFVPLSGVLIDCRVDLGSAIILPIDEARIEVTNLCERDGIKHHEENLFDNWRKDWLRSLDDYGRAFARVEVGRATSKRQDELVRAKTEDAVNFLRFWQHCINGYSEFYNRPHIGSNPPSVPALGLHLGGVTHMSLYLDSLGGIRIGKAELKRLNAIGLAETTSWQSSTNGTARLATAQAIRRFGHAWSRTDIEDRVMGSFRAFDGWLKASQQRNHMSATLARRLRILTHSDWISSKIYEDEFENRIYGPIRSAITHGNELNPSFLSWVDRIITDIGAKAIQNAIPVISNEQEHWSTSDFYAKLDTMVQKSTLESVP